MMWSHSLEYDFGQCRLMGGQSLQWVGLGDGIFEQYLTTVLWRKKFLTEFYSFQKLCKYGTPRGYLQIIMPHPVTQLSLFWTSAVVDGKQLAKNQRSVWNLAQFPHKFAGFWKEKLSRVKKPAHGLLKLLDIFEQCDQRIFVRPSNLNGHSEIPPTGDLRWSAKRLIAWSYQHKTTKANFFSRLLAWKQPDLSTMIAIWASVWPLRSHQRSSAPVVQPQPLAKYGPSPQLNIPTEQRKQNASCYIAMVIILAAL